MRAPRAGLLDTSVFIARESGRPLQEERLPGELVVSVITVAELHAGVLAAKDTKTRARRVATIESIVGITTLDVDAAAARIWAEMRVHLAETGRRVRVNDLWIAAVAAANRIPVVTQDDDFEPIHGVAGLEVIKV
ncbi:MAG TPA: type II toxin-antitoxin system VapC family toxin [Streptosporangiaceae bacterium]